ncbi:MAG: DUF5721 family protein [Mobilitalea sp.]
MISLNITEVKPFMAKLLTQSTFDLFILRELELQTFTNFTISGQFNEAFFTKEELEERGEKRFNLWSDIRSIALAMIKGNKTPLSLKIVFQLPADRSEELVQRSGGRLRMEDVGGLYLNVRFDKGELHIISGTAIKTFTMDKTLEQEWDAQIKNLLREQGITFEE